MALKRCLECNQEVSDRAITCPHCGIKTPVKGNSTSTGIIVLLLILGWILYAASNSKTEGKPTIGQPPPSLTSPAPQGDAKSVAEKIIRENFPSCKRVTAARRLSDGTISARCSGSDYLVFTMYDLNHGRMMELALNCNEFNKFTGKSIETCKPEK